jgi:3-oxoacyl-[acyl-carrier-protein] synthase III
MKTGISEMHAVLGTYHRAIESLSDDEELCGQLRENGLDRVYVDNEKTAYTMLEELLGQFVKKPDYVILTHSLPYLFGSHLCDMLAEGIPMINITGIPCCIMHKGVESAVSLVRSGRYERVLVIGADKCYEDYERIFFGTAMSDSVIGMLVEADTADHEIISSAVNTLVIASNGVFSDVDKTAQFRALNPSFIRTAMNDCLKKCGMGMEEVDFVVCHTSNRKIWDQVSCLTKIPREKFLDNNISLTGHMNSNDSFYHYFDFARKGIIRKGQKAMLVNPGFGGSQGCTLLAY